MNEAKIRVALLLSKQPSLFQHWAVEALLARRCAARFDTVGIILIDGALAVVAQDFVSLDIRRVLESD